jgi:hypothetical protein
MSASSPKVHLVGSFPTKSAEEAFRKSATGLKGHLTSIPDGEPGWRDNFTIGLLQKIVPTNPHIIGVYREYDEKFDPSPIKESSPEETQELLSKIPSATIDLGYADDAIASYKTFLQLREEGVMDKTVRFQVCLPGVSSFAIFVKPAYQLAVEDVMFKAMIQDVIKINKEIPAEDLAVQFDIASDFIKMEAQKDPEYLKTLRADFHPPKENAMERYASQYTELISHVDKDATVGLHICPGNINNKAVLDPPNTAVAVDLANNIAGRLDRSLAWVHFGCLPVWKKESHYSPLKDLKSGPKVFLGVVYPDNKSGAQERIDAARKSNVDFGISPPCGLARTSGEGVESVLDILKSLS